MNSTDKEQNESKGLFYDKIKNDLIKQGFSGEELEWKIKEVQAKIPDAVHAMIKTAKDAANGKGEFYTVEDVFGKKE